MRYLGRLVLAVICAAAFFGTALGVETLVVVIGGKLVKYFPELNLSGVEDGCDDFHYHPRTGTSVTALDGTVIMDSAPQRCGYGKLNALARGRLDNPMVTASDLDGDGLPNVFETQLGMSATQPDSDGDGVLDGDEDPDNDGSTNHDELKHATDGLDPDTDDDGILDGIDATLRRSEGGAIPVLIRLLKNSNADVNTIRAAVRRANQKLGPQLVAIRIEQLDTNGGDDGSGGGTAGDGILTPVERTKVRDAGTQNVFEMFGQRGEAGRTPLGLAISFTAEDGLRTASDLTMAGEAEKGGFSILIESGSHIDVMAANIVHGVFLVAGLENSTSTLTEDDDASWNLMTPGASGRDAFVMSLAPGEGFNRLNLTKEQWAKLGGKEAERISNLMTWRYRNRSPGVRIPDQGGASTTVCRPTSRGSRSSISPGRPCPPRWTTIRSRA